MPVDESADVAAEKFGATLEKLDELATKSVKALEKSKKKSSESEKGDVEPTTTGGSKEKKEDKKEAAKEEAKVGFREAFADQAGGMRGANAVFAFGKNPKRFAGNLLRSIPFIGGIVAAGEFAQAIIAELEKVDKFFKKFIDIIDNRINQLRDKVEIAHIRAGDTQLITTTQAGGTEPRESYNTFNQFNENRMKLETDFAVRDKSGV